MKRHECPRQFRDKAQMLLEMQEKIRYMSTKAKEMADELQKICNYQDMTVDGYTYKSFERKGCVVYSEIPELKTIDLDLYRSEPMTIWKLSYQKQFDL